MISHAPVTVGDGRRCAASSVESIEKKLNARFYVNPKLKQQIQFHPCQLYVNRLILQQFTMVYSVSFRLFHFKYHR